MRVPFVSTGLSVSAATTADGNFEYAGNEDGGVTITKYTGSDTEVVIPAKIDGKKVTSIGDRAFAYCASLTSVTIPDSVTSIGDGAFGYCKSMTSVTIPNSVMSIGDYAFAYCSSLTSVTIPDSVTSIGRQLFYECSRLTSVTIPDSVTNIGDWAFAWCYRLTSVTIPDSVMSIGDWAFFNCENLTSITIPDSVTSIGENAFYDCKGLTSVTIPDSVTSIGSEAFRGCEGLADEKGFVIIRDVLYGYYGNDTYITIPDSVTSIGDGAFSGCTSLTSVTIPDSVTSIGGHAFHDCRSLTSVTIPDSVTSIGRYAFYECTSLTSVTIPNSVTSIGESAFFYCSGLTSVTIPDSVTSIGDYAFAYCYSLTSVTIPDNVTSIGNGAFAYCDNVTIKGKKGSYAETYAKDNNIPFKAVTFPLTNKSTLSADSVVLGKSITVNCATYGGKGTFTYAVYYRKAGTTKWTTAQGYKTNATVTFKPKAAVNYEIRVAVKDASGKIERKDMTLAVKKPFTNTSKLNADTIQLGEKVKVRCFAENGEAPYTFSVQYKKSTSEKWTNVAINSTNNIFVLKPGAAVTYDIRVTAKSADGQASKKTLTLTVTK